MPSSLARTVEREVYEAHKVIRLSVTHLLMYCLFSRGNLLCAVQRQERYITKDICA